VFPNWDSCEITGSDSDGYGGTLECELFGPLQPQGAEEGATAAPTLTLLAEADPLSPATSIENIAAVDYHTFGNPDDVGHDEDNATVTVPTLVGPEEPEEPLPATGGSIPWSLALFGILALVFGTTLLVVRRRRGEAKPTL
jgi:LPXTG-motif cell wall-anchored protein